MLMKRILFINFNILHKIFFMSGGEKETIAVWFSCGAASAVAAKKTIEKYGQTHNVIIVNNPVMNEHEDNNRFLKDCEKWFGQERPSITVRA